jgi:hypothetical protein
MKNGLNHLSIVFLRPKTYPKPTLEKLKQYKE